MYNVDIPSKSQQSTHNITIEYERWEQVLLESTIEAYLKPNDIQYPLTLVPILSIKNQVLKRLIRLHLLFNNNGVFYIVDMLPKGFTLLIDYQLQLSSK